MCSFGGDVHKGDCHVPGGQCPGSDPHQLGLLKVTESVDGRFKTQMFQCQASFAPDMSGMNMVGMEIDGTTIVIRNPAPDEKDPDQGYEEKWGVACQETIQVRINDE